MHLPAPSSSHQLALPAALGRVFKGSTAQVKVSTTMTSCSSCTAQELSTKKTFPRCFSSLKMVG